MYSEGDRIKLYKYMDEIKEKLDSIIGLIL
mgnify:FL=1